MTTHAQSSLQMRGFVWATFRPREYFWVPEFFKMPACDHSDSGDAQRRQRTQRVRLLPAGTEGDGIRPISDDGDRMVPGSKETRSPWICTAPESRQHRSGGTVCAGTFQCVIGFVEIQPFEIGTKEQIVDSPAFCWKKTQLTNAFQVYNYHAAVREAKEAYKLSEFFPTDSFTTMVNHVCILMIHVPVVFRWRGQQDQRFSDGLREAEGSLADGTSNRGLATSAQQA